MARPAVVDGSDPQAVADTRVLIDCLQELVRGAYTPVRNCAKYPETVWLADVPERLVRRTADAGPTIMVVRHRPSEEAPRVPADAIAAVIVEPPAPAGVTAQGSKPDGPAPAQDGVLEQSVEDITAEVRAAYAAWARRWVRWSQQEQKARPERQLHQRLYRMAKKIQQDGDSVEAVLAIGLVQLAAERASARVCRHLVTVPVLLSIDRQTVDVTVSLSPGAPGRLEDMCPGSATRLPA